MPNTTPSIISIRGLNVWYRAFQALKNISLDIARNEITAFIGASGSGKSTVLRSINRMLDTIPGTRIEGEILFNGQNVVSDATDVIALRRRVGMVFQNPTPFPKSIEDNIAYGLEIQGLVPPRKKSILAHWRAHRTALAAEQSSTPRDIAVVKSLKEAALWEEVKDRLHQSAFRLSGGQQQRLCIARAIAVRPDVLLLDEPCSELDPISTRKIEDLLLHLKEHYTIVIVTHNMHQARRVSDRVGFFHLGELIEFGTTKDTFERPQESMTANYIRGDFG